MLMIYQVKLLEWSSTPAACKPPAEVFSLNLFSKMNSEIIVSSIDQLFKSHLGVIAIQIDSQTRPYGFWFSKSNYEGCGNPTGRTKMFAKMIKV